MQVTDLAEMSRLATKHGLLLIVDNTFLSPYLAESGRAGRGSGCPQWHEVFRRSQ